MTAPEAARCTRDLRAAGQEVRDGDPDRDAVGRREVTVGGAAVHPADEAVAGRHEGEAVAGRDRARRSGAGAPARDERPDEAGDRRADPLRRRPEVQVRDVRVGGDDAQPAGLQHQTGQVRAGSSSDARPRPRRPWPAARRSRSACSPCCPRMAGPAACPTDRDGRGARRTPRRASRRPARWRARCPPGARAEHEEERNDYAESTRHDAEVRRSAPPSTGYRHGSRPGGRQRNTTVRRPLSSTRCSACQRTARASTCASTSRPAAASAVRGHRCGRRGRRPAR